MATNTELDNIRRIVAVHCLRRGIFFDELEGASILPYRIPELSCYKLNSSPIYNMLQGKFSVHLIGRILITAQLTFLAVSRFTGKVFKKQYPEIIRPTSSPVNVPALNMSRWIPPSNDGTPHKRIRLHGQPNHHQLSPTPSSANHQQFTFAPPHEGHQQQNNSVNSAARQTSFASPRPYCFGQAAQNRGSPFKVTDDNFSYVHRSERTNSMGYDDFAESCFSYGRSLVPSRIDVEAQSIASDFSGFSIEQMKTADEIMKDAALPATVKRILQSWRDEAEKVPPDNADLSRIMDITMTLQADTDQLDRLAEGINTQQKIHCARMDAKTQESQRIKEAIQRVDRDYALEVKELEAKAKELEAKAGSAKSALMAQKIKVDEEIAQAVIKEDACLVRPKLCLNIAKRGLHLLQKKLRLGKIDEVETSEMNEMCRIYQSEDIGKMKARICGGGRDEKDIDLMEM